MPTTNSKNFIKLGNKIVGPGAPVFIVAEVANTHEGNFETAIKMVDALEGSGVDAIKFQLHIPEAEMLPSHPKFTTTGQRALSVEVMAKLKEYVERKGFYFLCSPFSTEAIDVLDALGVDAFKIGSGEVTDPRFIEHMAKKGKTMILSSGMSTLEELDEIFAIIRQYNVPHMLLHTVSVYPPLYDHLNLGTILKLKERFGIPIGLSDHTPEIFSAIASIPYGVSLIEKHYTLNRHQAGTSDHKVSLEPQEFKILVDAVRKIEKACGIEKLIGAEELATASWARHAVVSIKDISPGEIIGIEAVSTKRPLEDGIPAHKFNEVIGKRAKHRISKDSLIKEGDIE